jgi:aminopeptidase YwaD
MTRADPFRRLARIRHTVCRDDQSRSLTSRHPSLALALAACVAIVLTACSSGGDDDALAATPTPPTAAISASPTSDALGDPAPDGARAYEHVRKLTVDIGSRVAGTPDEIEARDYIARTLESYGYDVEVQAFAFDGTRFRSVNIGIMGGTTIAGVAFNGSPSGTVTGPIVMAGIGRPEEFPEGGIGGAIALIERGDLTFIKKAENAAEAGAAAVIIYNNEDGPFAGDAVGATLPIVSITREDGEALVAQLAASATEASIEIAAPASQAFNVIARPTGETSCTTVSGGHYDSVPAVQGADDNASGTGAVLELARVAAANRLPGANCFVLFGAEEFGLFGSQAYVESLGDAEVNGLRAMLNLDVVGTDAEMTLIGSDDLVELARVEAQEVGVEARAGSVPSGSGSDHFSFEQAGVPVVFFYRHDPLIHTEQDAIGRILPESLEETIRVAFGVLEALSDE